MPKVPRRAARSGKTRPYLELAIVLIIIGALTAILIPSIRNLTRESRLNADYAKALQLALVVDAALVDGDLELPTDDVAIRIDGSAGTWENREALRPFYEGENWPTSQTRVGEDLTVEITGEAEIRVFVGESFEEGLQLFPRPTEEDG